MNRTKAFGSSLGLSILRDNPSTPGAGMVAYVTGTYATGFHCGDIRRSLAADTVAGTASGAELVAHGSFDAGLTGWTKTQGDGSETVTGGVLTITQGATVSEEERQALTVVVGKRYRVSATLGGSSPFLFLGSTIGAADLGNLSATGFIDITATTTYLGLRLVPGTATGSGLTTTYTGISVKELVADRSVKAKNSSINGTLAMTAVASAAQLVAYSGFSNDPAWTTTGGHTSAIGSAANVIQEAYSADLDYGTAQWMAEGWFNVPSTGFGPANFLLQSADLTNAAWNKRGTAAVTGGLADPFGGTGAFTISGTDSMGSNNDVFQANAPFPSGMPCIPSAWINRLANTTGSLNIFNANDSARGQMVVDFALLGAGWQRVYPGHPAVTTVTPFTGSVNNQAGFYPKPTSGTAISFGIYGPQITRGSTLYPYTATTTTAFNGIAPIIDRSGPSGAYWRMGVDGNGFLAAEVFDGTTTKRTTSNVAVNDGNSHKALFNYTLNGPNGGVSRHYLYLDGAINTFSDGTMLTLNNANALLTHGNSFALNAAFPGSIALVRTGATVPFVEQIAFAYAQERQMFQPGAQVALPDTGAVVGLTYDDMTDQLVAATAANEATFTGLVRTATAPAAAGAILMPAARSGWKLMARQTTNPGVDVTVPSLNLREQLLRRVEDAARTPRVLPPVDFDATASQTDFVLVPGVEAQSVKAAGTDKREGASKDWQRKFDGFKETVSFNTGQSSGTWVQVIPRRAA